CVLRYYERFRPDALWLSVDTWVSAEAMGAKVAFTGDDQPLGGTGEPCIRCAADIDRIPTADPGSQGRYPLMIEALGIIRKALKQEVFIVACFDQYPFSLACALMGIERCMLSLTDDRSRVEALMERCHEYTLAYALALADAGADMLSGGDSPAGLLGPQLYREAALPSEKRLIADLKKSLGIPVSLHICGNPTLMLADMAVAGADVLELDHQVDIATAAQSIGPGIAIWGNLDPVGLLARGTPGQVREATRALIQSVRACGHRRFVVSSGCTLAMETPPENLEAMFEAASHPFPPQ
ncbi:MAG: uroporphyrinogen decarboxylase family protein, partial [Verrucomicrobiales bacterium]